MVAFVVLVTMVLLFFAFGSVLLPIKAVLMNVVSLGAAFGVVVLVFQDGHFASWLGFTPTGTIEPTNPILMVAVLFGLATDYEVFLLSRVREEYDATGDNTRAVATGLQRTGRLITSAALLLIVVVAGFATGEDRLRQAHRGRHDRGHPGGRDAGTGAAGTGHDAAARPVELVGPGSAGPGVPPHARASGSGPRSRRRSRRRSGPGRHRGGRAGGQPGRPGNGVARWRRGRVACGVMIVAQTQRLDIRPWTDSQADLDRLWDMYSRWEVMRFLGAAPKVMADPAEAAGLVARWTAPHAHWPPTYGQWAIEDRRTGVAVGTALLKPLPNSDGSAASDIEVGWHLHPDSWGHGYATEAAGALVQRAFAAGVPEVFAVVYPENTASLAVCRRLGMESIGETDRWYGIRCAAFRIRPEIPA